MKQQIEAAARAITEANFILIGAGAGIGVDSGLPDFRGKQGFWKAYPALARQNISFTQAACPEWFGTNPARAWGFYGHRLNLYRETSPHAGFDILREWFEAKDGFVYTSNVDGHFQKAGFDPERIIECHGSINHFQCIHDKCASGIWDAAGEQVKVFEQTLKATPPYPKCPLCGSVARPNILMFGDFAWDPERTNDQRRNKRRWEDSISTKDKVVVIEMGAGTAIPSVRNHCEDTQEYWGATLIRINPRESEGPKGTISIPCGSLDALRAIKDVIDDTR